MPREREGARGSERGSVANVMMMMKLKLICQHFLIVVTDFALLWHAKQLKMCLHVPENVRMCLKARVYVSLFFIV